MNSETMIKLCKQHTIYSWNKQSAVNPIPVERAEGVYFWTPEGKRYLDWNSQVMSVNIGHGNKRVVEAMKAQLDVLPFAGPATATPVRAELGKLLSEIVPGDINTFFFTNGGAEANENAIKAARYYTGRFKILSRYRSYHGATNACMQLTGDPRRWASEPGAPGFVHVMDPWPYDYSFGQTDEEITRNNLQYLEEVIMYEGPQNIAAMFIETVTGTNGVLPPPRGYLKGLRELLSRHGILMICDEVMAGFGRTGRLFAFEHADIVPDIVCMAKGLTSSYAPLGCMGLSDAIAAYFQDNVFWGGLTYNGHPLALASAVANIGVLRDDGLVENAARLERVMREEMDRLTEKHVSVKTGRCIGLFGMMDLQINAKGEPVAPYGGSHPALTRFKSALLDRGLFTFVRWSSFMCNPPLCITEEQLREGYAIIDDALEIVDAIYQD